MDQNSSNSTLGSGTDSLSVTGAGAGQNSTSGGYTPSQGGSQGTGNRPQDAQSNEAGTLGQQAQNAAHNLGDKATTAYNQVKDQAGDRLNQAKDMANERLGQAREKATELKATLADKLDQGAQTIRTQTQGGGQQQFAAAGAGGAAASLAGNEQVQRLAGPTADAMEKTADFLRNGDLREAIEEQVRTAPGRTLLIALGVGYLLGKAIRR